MRNIKICFIALGLAFLATGCCSTNSSNCSSNSTSNSPGFFSRMRNCMCGEKEAIPVSYGTAPIYSGPIYNSGPMLNPPSNGTIPPAGIYENPGKQMPFKPEDKETSRPAKPISEVKLPKDPLTGAQ